MAAFKGVINCVHPNAAIYSFDANMVMSAGDAKKLSLSAEQARPGLHPLARPYTPSAAPSSCSTT